MNKCLESFPIDILLFFLKRFFLPFLRRVITRDPIFGDKRERELDYFVFGATTSVQTNDRFLHFFFLLACVCCRLAHTYVVRVSRCSIAGEPQIEIFGVTHCIILKWYKSNNVSNLRNKTNYVSFLSIIKLRFRNIPCN